MKIMMFAHGGSLNRGCEAIVRSSTNIIKSGIKESNIILASDRPETDKVIPKLDKAFDSSACEIDNTLINKIKCAIDLKLFKRESYALGQIHKKIINKIDDVDVCLSIGGDNYCYGEQPWLYEIDRRIKKKGKKLILWGCSIGEEDITSNMLEDLKGFDLILARESLTYNMLKNKGLSNVRLCADPAFTMEKEEVVLPKEWKDGDTIGINFSPLVLKRNLKSKDAVRELIKHILKSTKSTIALTPHVIIDGNNDYETLYDLYEEFKDSGRVIILPDNLTAIQYKGYISKMRCFIGARTHATIAAYSTCVPTMVLGYSVKSRGIAKDIFGTEKLVLGINEISDDEKLKNAFDEMIREEKEIKDHLIKKIPEIKNMSFKSVEYLKELMKK